MAVTMKDLGIDQLNFEDRLALVEEIWDSIASEPANLPISETQKQLIDQRIADLNANPRNVLTWEEIKQHIKGKK